MCQALCVKSPSGGTQNSTPTAAFTLKTQPSSSDSTGPIHPTASSLGKGASGGRGRMDSEFSDLRNFRPAGGAGSSFWGKGLCCLWSWKWEGRKYLLQAVL